MGWFKKVDKSVDRVGYWVGFGSLFTSAVGGAVMAFLTYLERVPWWQIMLVSLLSILLILSIIAIAKWLFGRPRPHVKMMFEGANFFSMNDPHMGGNPEERSVALIGVKIWNQGSDTYIVDWKLELIGDNNERTSSQLTDISGHQKDGIGNTIEPSTSLVLKMNSIPVTNTPISGSLLFWFPLPYENLVADGVKFELEVTDSLGNISLHIHDTSSWLQA